MVTENTLPSLVGYHPDEAKAIAAECGVTLVWVDAAPPRWLPPHHEPRVGRQRVLEDGRVELLRVLAPSVVDSSINM